MAKQEVKEEQGVVETPVTEELQENKQQAPEAQVTKEPKKVKIHTTEEIDCIIAGIPYKFPKDKDAQVPPDVAAILVNAKKVYRQ